jgi:hypothetical protein
LPVSSDNLSGLGVTSGLRSKPISFYHTIHMMAPQKL